MDTVKKSSGYAEVNGLSMYYEIYGDGYPLVLIHGGGSTINTSFGRLIPFLAGQSKIIAMELQAHGRTADRGTPTSFEQDADDVAALLKHLGIQKSDIMGFSNGGNTAMQLAARNPSMVNKLVIASAFYKRDGMIPGFWDGMNKAGFEDMPQAYKDEFLLLNNDSAALYTMFVRDATRMQGFKDWNDSLLLSITAPTLVICGDRDVVTSEHAVKMSGLIKNSRLAIIPGGHGSFMGELTTLENGKWNQEYCAELIRDFIRQP